MARWINRTAVAGARNGTTSHTYSFTPATAGNLLLVVGTGPVTATTPTGWTLPTNGSAVNLVGLYVWHKIAAAGESSFTTTHNSANFAFNVVVYEFAAGSTFVSAVSSGTLTNPGGANPTLSGLTGTNLTMAVVSGVKDDTVPNPSVATWTGAATEDFEESLPRATTDGFGWSVAYTEDNTAASFAPTGSLTETVHAKHGITWAVKVTPPPGRWRNRTVVDAPRNGTTSHTINFTPAAAGSLLVAIVEGGVTSTTPTGWTLPTNGNSVNGVGMYVWHKTATAGESSFTTTHNGSNYPVLAVVYEFDSGSAFGAAVQNATLTNSPVTANPAITPTAGYLGIAVAATPMGVTTITGSSWAWTGATENVDSFVPMSGTDGYTCTVGYLENAPATSWAPTATATHVGSANNTELKQGITFTVNAVGGVSAGPTVTAGRARPVLSNNTVALDVTATPPSGQTISGHSWTVQSGGGTLTNATTATPTYTAPSGTGLAVIRDTVTDSGGGTATADVTVGYAPNIVAAENQLTGTARTTWDLPTTDLGGIATLQGFADGFSFNKDQTVNFKIGQSDTAGWAGTVYRLGWYAGLGAREYGSLTTTSVATSQAQPAPTDADPDTTLLSADAAGWSVTGTWTPPTWAPSGIYVLRLNRTGGGASHVVFILRDDNRVADLMFMPADSTWNAYNAWGGLGAAQYTGNSLYYGTALDQYNADCAHYVSYNRPSVNRGAADNSGSRAYGAVEWSTFFTGEYPMQRFIERNGIDVKYYGCIDAAGDATGTRLIGKVKAAIFVGHNEYWSDGMRAGWEAAKAAGMSVFSCSGNEVFWRLVGDQNDAVGRPRRWECQKSTINGRGSTRPQWTGTWRDPDGAGKGGNNPENTFTGTIFVVNGPDMRSLVVPKDGGYADQPLWRHTSVAGLAAGQSYTSPAQILGFEWDTYGPAGTSNTGGNFMAAPNAQIRYCSDATYTIPSGLLLIDAGDVYGTGTATHRLVVQPSGTNGGITFGTGTINWALGVDNANTYQGIGNDNTAIQIQQATVNIFTDMGAPSVTLMSGLTAPTAQSWYQVSVPVPTGLTVTPVSTTRLDLSWSAAAGATGYDVERNGTVIVTGQTGTTYSDTGLTPATTYTYRVRSVK